MAPTAALPQPPPPPQPPLLLPSAQRVLARLGAEPPPRGTGPLSGGGSTRWATALDVLVHAQRAPREEEESPGTWVQELSTAPWMEGAGCGGEGLRDYQEEAVARACGVEAAAGAPSVHKVTFRSGVFEIGCGLGKTWVGGALVRRTGAPAVVVTQHATSVDQWVAHLTGVVGLRDVHTLASARDAKWTPRAPLPGALVLTYHALVRAAAALDAHADRLARGAAEADGGEAAHTTLLVALLHCEAFGALVLDEAHLAVADHFRVACNLRARVVWGLSGSLVREDARLARLTACVGPPLYTHVAARGVAYEVLRVPVEEGLRATLAGCRKRSATEHALRALNPRKVAALRALLAREHGRRVLVFCDSRRAAALLARAVGALGPLDGGVDDATRAALLATFAEHGSGVLVATRVCDAAIDFPDGCVVVQHHCASGSRQQEVQRCGRGARGVVKDARVVHLVNEGTEEEGFVARRVAHVQATLQGVRVIEARVVADLDDAACAPAKRLCDLRVPQPRQSRKRTRMAV